MLIDQHMQDSMPATVLTLSLQLVYMITYIWPYEIGTTTFLLYR